MRKLASFLILISLAFYGNAQSVRRDIRQGNRQFKKEKFSDSEASYRKAVGDKKVDEVAEFNLGDALYRQKKFEDAGHQFEASASKNVDRTQAAKAYHNLGNSMLQAGKIDESIEAYKNALRRNPSDLDTKYNLAYAQMMKKKQDQQKQQQGNDKNQNNKDQQNKQDQNKDQQKQNQDQQQQQQDQQKQNQDQQKQDQQKAQNQNGQKSEPQQGKEQNMKMSKEDAKRLLEALANDEKQVQDKVKKEKANANKVKTIKDW